MDRAVWTLRFHAAVDEVAGPVARIHHARLKCAAGCHDCCSDGLTVFALEAELITKHYPALLASEAPHPDGACAFLNAAGECRVYEHRPYVCRTQGLPLRWIDEDEDTGELFEGRDICPKNVAGTPLEELEADACWSIGPFEEKLAAAQRDGERVALRSLFDQKRRLPITK